MGIGKLLKKAAGLLVRASGKEKAINTAGEVIGAVGGSKARKVVKKVGDLVD